MSDFEFSKPTNTKLPGSKATTKQPAVVKTPLQTTTPANSPEVEVNGDMPENAPEYPAEELMAIFDELMFHGEYSEEILLKGKLAVRFRTRSSDEIQRISTQVDSHSGATTLLTTLTERRSILNLEYALINYGTRDLSSVTIEDKGKFIGNLPAPIVASLLMALHEFDKKVFAACKEGEENF